MLATLKGQLALGLALDALQSQDNLLGGLGLLVEDGLGLTTITGLLAVVTTLSLGEKRSLTSLVLGDLVLGVLAALSALAVGVAGLGNVDLFPIESVSFSWVGSIAVIASARLGRMQSLTLNIHRPWFRSHETVFLKGIASNGFVGKGRMRSRELNE